VPQDLPRDLLGVKVGLGPPDALQHVEGIEQEMPAATGRVDHPELLRVVEVGWLALLL